MNLSTIYYMTEEVVKKKRGRKPKIKNEIAEEKLKLNDNSNKTTDVEPPKKKRGRKKKIDIMTQEDKEKTEELEKIPRKRGRKPKNKVYGLSNNQKVDKDPNVILHLPIRSKLLESDSYNIELDNIIKYKPEVSDPKPYEGNISIDNNSNLALPEPYQNVSMYEPINDNESEDDNHIDIDEDEKNNDCETYEGDNNDNKNYRQKKDEELLNMEEIVDVNEINNNDDYNNTIKKKIHSFMSNFCESSFGKKSWPTKTNIYCMWCCHPFSSIPCAIPEKIINNTFHMSGCFCNFSCVAAYIFDKKDDLTWERYSLLNLLYSKIFDVTNVRIKLAPPRETLNIFGGSYSIDEFRKYCSNAYHKKYNILEPPMISIISQIEEITIEKNNKNLKKFIPLDTQRVTNANENLKLKRKSNINMGANTLENCMGLKTI